TYSSSVSEPALINGLIDYSDYLKEVTNDNDSAQAVIQLGRELLPSNEDLKQQYDKIFEQ
ncbi:MAG: hypothetical protein AAGB22_12945, partial [Bacteroidota bacterium]